MSKEIRYYSEYTDDLVTAKNQDYKLKDDYKWVRTDPLSGILSFLIYALALIFSTVYCRLFLHVRFKNTRILRQTRKCGVFLYCNHTQPIGDVFDPALACFPNRIYTVVSPSNYGIPVIGKLLPYLGALPISDSLGGMRELNKAIEYRLKQKRCIVIYPEAHVWEYYTRMRPFPDTSFRSPIKFNEPVYTLTATYQKRKWGRKPKIVMYADGPFYPDSSLSAKQQATFLHDIVYDIMCQRSQKSDCKYIEYRMRSINVSKEF